MTQATTITGKNLVQLNKIVAATTGNGLGTASGNEWVNPTSASISDILQAIDWLLMNEWADDTNAGAAFINVAEMLSGEVLKRMKKNYAKANNCKVSQVKFVEVA